MAPQEIKKMKQGMTYSYKEKTIILNVFKYFRLEMPDLCVTELVRRTAKATGCSEKSVFQFRKEEASAEGLKIPTNTKTRRNININSRDNKYDENVRQAIRTVIYDLKCKNIVPSLNVIVREVNGDPRLPNFSLMTLRRLLFDMGFRYEKTGNKSLLVDKIQQKGNCVKETIKTKVNTKMSLKDANNSPVVLNTKPLLPSNKSPKAPQINNDTQNMHLPTTAVLSDNNHHFIPPPPHLPNMHLTHHNVPIMLNHHQMPQIRPGASTHYYNNEIPNWMHHPTFMKHE